MAGDQNNSDTEKLFLSVVVIGRNEASRLPALFASLPPGNDSEWIYVDSQSVDNSVELALGSGAKVFLLEPGSVYAPATGRHIGTLEAGGKWILYLDGDMLLRTEFIALLEKLKAEEGSLPPGTAGFTGVTCNRYLDSEGKVSAVRDHVVLSKSELGPLSEWGREVSYHGGAVLYRRSAVIAAGNWNPALLQLEETELCSRIRSGGGKVRAVDLPMVDHYTHFLGSWEKLKMNFLPHWRGKALYGAGQVVAARAGEGTLLQFICCYPYPFVILAGVLSAPLFLLWPPLPLLINAAIALWVGITKKWYYYLVYLGNLFHILYGLNHYRPFKPRYWKVGKGSRHL